jgi:hypothetical protein
MRESWLHQQNPIWIIVCLLLAMTIAAEVDRDPETKG